MMVHIDRLIHGHRPRVLASHARWVPWLGQALHGVADAQLQPEVIGRDDCSELGQWLRGSGQHALGHLPVFDLLVRRNRFFHTQAAEMLGLRATGDLRQAEHAFKACRHASTQVVVLKELCRSLLSRHWPTGPTKKAAGAGFHDETGTCRFFAVTFQAVNASGADPISAERYLL